VRYVRANISTKRLSHWTGSYRIKVKALVWYWRDLRRERGRVELGRGKGK
jgi:hypothetical protein